MEGLDAAVRYEQGEARIEVSAVDEAGRPRNFLDVTATAIDPNLGATEAKLMQTGAGQYAAAVDAAQPGAYLVNLTVGQDGDPLGGETLGLVAPYSPEYRLGGTDRSLLGRLAALTGGEELPDPLAAFARTLPFSAQVREIWAALLLIVALLFPLHVALRRVMFGSSDLRRATGWVQSRLPSRQREERERDPVLGQLFNARSRVRTQQARPPEPSTAASPVTEDPRPSTPAETPPTEDDPMARLREAKRRARR